MNFNNNISVQNVCYCRDHAAKINNVVNVTKLTFDTAKFGKGLPGPSSPQLDSTSSSVDNSHQNINKQTDPMSQPPPSSTLTNSGPS